MKLLKSSFWLHSIFYTLLQRFSLFFFGAVAYMVLARGLSANGSMAIWALYLTILSLFETVKQGLLRNPTIKFLGLSEYANRKAEVQSSSMVINLLFSALTLIGLVAGSGLISNLLKSPDLIPLLHWSAAFIILLVPFNHFEILLQARYHFQQIFWAYFVRQGSFFIGILILFFFAKEHFTLMNLMIMQLVSLLAGTIMLFNSAKQFMMKKFHYDKSIIVRMFHFGKYIFGTNLCSNVTRSFDHFITANTLSPLSGKQYVSYYNTVARINNMIDVPSLAAADVLFPKNVESLEEHGIGKVKYYFERMVGTILAVIIPICIFIFLFPKFIIFIIAGPNYYDAIPILQITIFMSLVKPIGYQYGSTLDAIGKPVVNFWTSAVMMVIALVTTWLCLLKWDGIGAAYATVLNSIIGGSIMYFVLKKQIQLEGRNIIRYTLQSYKDIWAFRKKLIRQPVA
ncbi:oligosaccharide flippase family protein [Pseudobacter ginsenosidimutans]|uniref:O-antigen/teichoic acid export membrane protein n=1 Tax=Pseudobacter ginsenosidimutans TaxID=661488 RepID=A0A4Q7N5N1_9BACT|nr:oligosaccharide flippase family protein [Pseudobacter ginsenosidimutans]QEC44874.1 oligosaccharide flippase family protein [Pseudobacter ginsenosidimutans]RZS76365.1 O-antigen/teichoic acid export membrane protein [Pseudobacter ginsenosidimutans]